MHIASWYDDWNSTAKGHVLNIHSISLKADLKPIIPSHLLQRHGVYYYMWDYTRLYGAMHAYIWVTFDRWSYWYEKVYLI